ncbi:MAG: copper chaperone PCu(A)C [Steroidobacteraceae bacterium]
MEMRMRQMCRLLLVVVLAWTVGCSSGVATPDEAADASSLRVEKVWSRATPPGASVGVMYLQIYNDGAADQLLSVQSPVSETASIHRTVVDENGIARMEMVAQLDLPAGAHVVFEPSGMHVMLTGLRQPLVEGATVPLTLEFLHAGRRQIAAKVYGIGALSAGEQATDHAMHH